MALGVKIIQKRKRLSDRAVIKELTENPYLQYKEHNIAVSGPKPGRRSKANDDLREKKQDNADRIEVERFFSRDKRCNGQDLSWPGSKRQRCQR